ncbi:MAG TPA: hypothetical protein VG826_19580 [Pirellulales bacterium]|nr:hypothetical protein [Pirellulales bacterium]
MFTCKAESGEYLGASVALNIDGEMVVDRGADGPTNPAQQMGGGHAASSTHRKRRATESQPLSNQPKRQTLAAGAVIGIGFASIAVPV